MLVQIKTFGRKPMRDNEITKMLLAVLLAICVSVTTARSAELIPLRATYAAIGGAFAPFWIAQDKGVFNKYGLAVDLKYMLSATGTQALLSGSMDIVNPATELIEALTQGRIDAAIISAPTTLKARQAGLKELVDITAKNIPMIHAGLATTRDFIKTNPDKVRRYVQAYIESNKIARTDPETTK